MKLSIIACVAKNGVIGKEGKLPWHIPDDLAWFKETIGNCPLIVGRKTFDSLPNSFKYNELYMNEFFVVGDNLPILRENEEAFIIGGANTYARYLEMADRMLINHLDAIFEGDCHFPPVDWSEWIKEKERYKIDIYSGVRCCYTTYVRKKI